jgi:hypothetical protein
MIHLRRLETQEVHGTEGPTHGIFVGFDINDRKSTPELVSALAEQFKLQRMISPPDTSLLFVSVIGDFESSAFVEAWQTTVKRDAALSHFISQFQRAALVHGTRDGRVLAEESLLLPLD